MSLNVTFLWIQLKWIKTPIPIKTLRKLYYVIQSTELRLGRFK
jgi:hypothetical protein